MLRLGSGMGLTFVPLSTSFIWIYIVLPMKLDSFSSKINIVAKYNFLWLYRAGSGFIDFLATPWKQMKIYLYNV